MNDIRGTLMSITRNVTKSSGDLLKATKLTVSLANEQELLKGIYLDIGKKVHEIYMFGGTLGKFFDEKYKEIEASEQKINDLKEKISVIKGTRECPKCGKNIEKTSEFCSKCGFRLEGSAAAAFVPASERVPVSEMSATPSDIPVPTKDEPREKVCPAPEMALPPVEPAISELDKGVGAPASDMGEPVPPAVPDMPAKRTCIACGSANDLDTKFCLTCGRIL